jgi:hypothetical protein
VHLRLRGQLPSGALLDACTAPAAASFFREKEGARQVTGIQLQERDRVLLGSVLRWGLLPAWFLAAWYFGGSKRTAENRLGELRRAGCLRRVETWWRGHWW